MNYIISSKDRETLRQIILQSDLDDEDKEVAREIFEDIKKQTIEEIASGEIVQLTCYYEDDRTKDLLGNCEGTNSKVYIQKEATK